MKKLTGSTLIFCITVVMALVQATAYAQGRWVKLAPLPEAAEEVLGAAAGGKLYVFAGIAPGWKPKSLVYEYDPATDKWTKKKPMALASHHVAITELGEEIYAFGGFVLPASGPAAWQPVDNAFEYDPATDSWKALAPMPTKRGAAGAAAVGGKLYVIGGGNRLDLVEEYDVAADSWNPVRARMPTARSAVAYGVHGGRVYVAGGEHQSYNESTAYRAFEAFDAATKQWIVLPPMPLQRHGLAGAVLGNRMHVVSGDVQSAGTGLPMHTDAHDAFEFGGTAK